MTAYYNEIDPYAVRWLHNLIAAGHIAPGEVDDRSIIDVCPGDLAGFNQCHFFAGIGVWSYALRLAGWPDDRHIWTASCPCQPFSTAGKGGGFDDERHLWPALFHLIRCARPQQIIGEQVALPDGLAWLDLVHDDMEGESYTIGAVDCCAAGVGSPHIRQRLWWMGVPAISGPQGIAYRGNDLRRSQRQALERTGGDVGVVGEPSSGGRERIGDGAKHVQPMPAIKVPGQLGDPELRGRNARVPRDASAEESAGRERGANAHRSGGGFQRPGPVNGFWRDADWLRCRDEQWRPVEPGSSPLVTGVASRVGRLRAYGNSINAHAAAEVIRAFMECAP